ncbi:GntR family transcriptional regulator [Leisingera thetidis]|uniref:GntR family transcriptional regulator n=1 Tax=Leisingera thetidis TaxID=2930199 RepID=UPI0021F6A68B|nr:GntR family transcriptional regulator [Leisingera thetidis]
MDGKPAPKKRRGYNAQGKLTISRLSLHEQVVNQLREMIVSGILPTGEKIRFNELAEELQVSLTPLREALKVLAGEQLVELMPNRGARVAPITVAGTKELFEVIAGIEALAAELAAARITDEQLAGLEQLHQTMRGHHERGETAPYFELNREIHDNIVAFAGNETLQEMRAQLARRAERARFISVSSGPHRIEAMQDHDELMQALRARDAKAAHAVWRRHLLSSGEETCRILKNWEADRERAQG